jgi:hypothetical protein
MVRWNGGVACLIVSLAAYACSGNVVGSSKTVDVGNDGKGGAGAQGDGGDQRDGGPGAGGDGGTPRDAGGPLDAGPLDGGAASDAASGATSSPHSGTRIKVRGVTTPDGTAPFATTIDGNPVQASLVVPRYARIPDEEGGTLLFDSSRKVGCQMALAQDGVTRCLPDSSGGQVYFTDAACTVPVIEQSIANGCPTPGRYATRIDPLATCWENATTTVYSLGAHIAAPAMIYSSSKDGCSATPGDSSSFDFFEASVSPPVDWVSFETKVEKVTSRLGVAVLAGADGSLVPLKELRLLPEDSACEGVLGTDQRLRCIPKQRGPLYANVTSSVYSGAACQAPAVPWSSCTRLDVLADFVGELGGGVKCGPRALSGAVHLASKVAPSDVFVIKPGTAVCTSLSRVDGSTDDYYVAGDVLPETAFPLLETVHDGSGRIQTTYVSTEGHKLYASGLYDTETKSDCMPLPFGAETVCAPSPLPNIQDNGTYTDSGCSSLLYDPNQGFFSDPCAAPASFVLVGGGVDACGYLDPRHQGGTLHRVGALHVGATYTLGGAPGTCDKSGTSTFGKTYDLGPAVAPATVLASLTPVDL